MHKYDLNTKYWPFLYSFLLQNFHVQAHAYVDKGKLISDDMEEGGLSIITDFYTWEALGTLWPATSKIIINF